MTIGAVLPPPLVLPVDHDAKHQLYGFHCAKWEELPIQIGSGEFSNEERYRRNADRNAYHQQYGNPIGWNRYLNLGFYALNDCGKFKQLW